MLFAVLFFSDKINCFCFRSLSPMKNSTEKQNKKNSKQEKTKEKKRKEEKTKDISKYFNYHQKHIDKYI